MEKITPTPSQKLALEYLKTGQNCFITGEAGTGKTWVINKFLRDYCRGKKVLKCALTGLAASMIRGAKTLHSAFGLTPFPSVYDREYQAGSHIFGYDIILIDEISMCRIDIFECILRAIDFASKFQDKKIQIILCGDFYQLPPVTKPKEAAIIGQIYGVDKNKKEKIYAFESDLWKQFNFKKILLKEPVRTKDLQFLTLLREIKEDGDDVQKTLDQIKTLSSKHEFDKSETINLFASNLMVDWFNFKALKEIDSPLETFNAKLDDYVKMQLNKNEIKIDDLPAPLEIKLKVGAKVMFTKNDTKSPKQFVNGSWGKVVEAKSNDYVVIDVYSDDEPNTIAETVKFEINSTKKSHMKRIEFNYFDDPICRNKKVYQNDTPRTMWQLPIKLAYALTIHKSQGQTFDKLNFDPQADGERPLECGQLYVVLSRLKKIDGLYLGSKILRSQCKTSPKVKEFDKEK